jgi:CubicO group peptidase (beta-lactamase class C family)
MTGEQRITTLLEHFITMRNGPAGCALSVSVGDKLIYEGYHGFSNIESARKIGPDTLYRMYSCSKIITAAALLLLLERGQVQLDDPVFHYLPEYKNAVYCRYTGNNIETQYPVDSLTIKHLLTMTSGLTYEGCSNTTQLSVGKVMKELNAQGGFTTREFARRMAEVPLAFQPGTHWNYGVGHDVLGAVIEEASGRPFGAFLKDEIFEPVGMKDTAFFVDEQDNRLATLYYYENEKLMPNRSDDYRFRKSYRFESGGGGLVSSLNDMSRFARMLALGGVIEGTRVMGRKTIELMRQNHLCPSALDDFRAAHINGWEFMSGYGYGLGVKTCIDLPGSNCIGSPGDFSWAGAAGTLLVMDSGEGLSFAYMHQLMPNNMEGYCHPRIKNTVYGQIFDSSMTGGTV